MSFEVSETTLRLSIFIGLLALFFIAETLLSKRARTLPRVKRVFTNLTMMGLSSVLLALAFPMIAIGTAAFAAEKNWGVFNLTAWPIWLEFILAMIIFDFTIWAQHVATHKIPLLWRLHKVHHADRDIDVTTGLRFHPIEIALSMLYKMGIVLALGPSVLAVLIFEIILNGCALFNHSNLKLPPKLDRFLRLILITPDFHRVHHSATESETNRNYGFSVPWWDWLFRTYQAQPEKGHNEMTIGLSQYQSEKPGSLLWSLLLPFKSDKDPSA